MTPFRGLRGFYFLIPALTLIIVFVVYPTLGTILLSFNVNPVPGIELVEAKPGFENYARLIRDRDFLDPRGVAELRFPMGALIHNAIWIALHVPVTVFFGYLLALIFHTVPGGSVVRSMIFLGMVVPMVVGGLLIVFSYDPDIGVFNLILRVLGLGGFTRNWIAYPDTALLALIAGSVWLWTGFSVTLYAAGLASIPREVIDAAVVDGARFWRLAFEILFPMLRPVTVTVVAMTILWDLKIFDIVWVATRGGPGGSSMVLAVLMYLFFAREGDYAMSAAVATVLTLLVLPVALLWIRMVVKGGIR